MECIYCKKDAARKKGLNTLSGGKKQQIWHCRECGKTFQTRLEDGSVVDN